jgi:hypothetical protein
MTPKPAVLWKSLFALSLITLIAGCDPGWTIASVKVNPQPLSGTDPNSVVPVMLVAPAQNGGSSRFDVDFEIDIQRDAGFQSLIQVAVDGSFSPPNGKSFMTPDFQAFLIPGTATRGEGPLFVVFCTRQQSAGGAPQVRLDVLFPAFSRSGFAVTVTDATVAKTSVGVGGVSSVFGSNGGVYGWSAAHPLDISCFLNPPIN